MKKLIAIFFWLVVWQILSILIDKPVILPGVDRVFFALFKLLGEKEFYLSVIYTFLRIISGFLLGIATGSLLALISLYHENFELLFSPVISVCRSTPVASIIILALVWLKKPFVPIFIVMLVVLPIIYQCVFDGIKNTPDEYVVLGKTMGMNHFQLLKYIQGKMIIPAFKSSCVVTFGLAWKSGIAAEVLAVPLNSIGYNIYRNKIGLETEKLFAWTIVVVIMSLILQFLLKFFDKLNSDESK